MPVPLKLEVLSIYSWVSQHPVFLGVDIEKLVSVRGFCPFFRGGLSCSFDII
jgi:hypothetical protein